MSGACASYQEMLSRHLDGDLGDAERAEVEGHLSVCPACAAEGQELKRCAAALRSLPRVAPPADFLVRLEKSLREPVAAKLPAAGTTKSRMTKPGTAKPVGRLVRLPFQLVGAAAALLLVAVLVDFGRDNGAPASLQKQKAPAPRAADAVSAPVPAAAPVQEMLLSLVVQNEVILKPTLPERFDDNIPLGEESFRMQNANGDALEFRADIARDPELLRPGKQDASPWKAAPAEAEDEAGVAGKAADNDCGRVSRQTAGEKPLASRERATKKVEASSVMRRESNLPPAPLAGRTEEAKKDGKAIEVREVEPEKDSPAPAHPTASQRVRSILTEVNGTLVAEELPTTSGAPSWMIVEVLSDRLEDFLSRLEKMGKLQRFGPVPAATRARRLRIRISLREEAVLQ